MVELLLFLGAGASKQFGLPTLHDLTMEILKEFPAYSKELRKIRATLKHFHFNDNIEGILTILRAWTNPRPAFHESGPFITQVTKCKYLRDLHGVQKYKRWVRRIENYIHQRCTVDELATIHKICRFYDTFWNDLIRKYRLENYSSTNCPYIDVFMTNYDNVLEEYCYERGVVPCTGYREFAGGRLGFDPDSYFYAEDTIRLYKLHGSIHLFKLESGDIVRLNHLPGPNTRIHGRKIAERILIFPAIAKHYFSEPHLELLAFLKRKLAKADDCIVVGYSFGDRSIKSVFFDAAERNRQLRIILVSPSAEKIAESELEQIRAEVLPIPCTFEDFQVLDL